MPRLNNYRKFNSLKYTFLAAICLIILVLAFYLLKMLIGTILINNSINYILIKVISLLLLITFCLILYGFYVLYEEIHFRKKYDSLSNYLKSFQQTTKIRKFLNHRLIGDSNSQDLFVQNAYNKFSSKTVIDIQEDKIIVVIFLPNSKQAKKLLVESLMDIREEVSMYNENFFFSAPTRQNNIIYFMGSKT